MGVVVLLLGAQLRKKQPSDFPRYEIVIDGGSKYLSLACSAEALYESLGAQSLASIGKLVLEANHSFRPMTETEKLQLHAFTDMLRTYGTKQSRA